MAHPSQGFLEFDRRPLGRAVSKCFGHPRLLLRYKRKTWEATHLTFYYGMRANGAGEIKAKVMYYAVYKFGPRWKMIAETISKTIAGNVVSEVFHKLVEAAPQATQGDLQELQELQAELEAKGPMTLEQLRERADGAELMRFPSHLR